MSVSMIDQNDINSLLMKIGIELKGKDPSICIIRFGSSQHKIPVDNIDIDILLMTKMDYWGKKIGRSIKALRHNLINGHEAKGFSTSVPMITTIVENVLSLENAPPKLNFIPKYIFGPFVYDEKTLTGLNIYLHFKGPLNNDQFLMFCKEMPFHAYSLIQDNKTIFGSVDLTNYKNVIDLNKITLNDFNRGLKIRVEKSSNKIDLIKCIRKLLLNCRLFTSEGVEIDHQNYHIENLESNDINELKSIFEKLYYRNLK